jgi:hypothetical protein
VFSRASYFTSSDVGNYMISVPCHGAVIGAWLGAWPMPLDWERPWQVRTLIVTLMHYVVSYLCKQTMIVIEQDHMEFFMHIQ